MENNNINNNIPVVILCGGKGTRIGHATRKIPKPLIEIGGKPVLWHIMKIYSANGYRNFILCLGYKGNKIIEYFSKQKEDWNIVYSNAGVDCTKTARIKAIKKLIKTDKFFLAYGDDLADINISKLLKFHKKARALVTITIARLSSEFGIVSSGRNGLISEFKEKPLLDKWINGGFMVINTDIFKYLHYGELESEVFNKLVDFKKIFAYKHKGQWKAMNTLKDNLEMNVLWDSGKAFWKNW